MFSSSRTRSCPIAASSVNTLPVVGRPGARTRLIGPVSRPGSLAQLTGQAHQPAASLEPAPFTSLFVTKRAGAAPMTRGGGDRGGGAAGDGFRCGEFLGAGPEVAQASVRRRATVAAWPGSSRIV